MSRRARLAPILIGVVIALVGVQGAGAALPTLYAHYTMTCTFNFITDTGVPVTAVPPEAYQILVTSPTGFAEVDLSGATDPNLACGGSLKFRLTGPGVDVSTTLDDGDGSADQIQVTLQAGTYTALDEHRPAVTRATFSVSSGAASTGGGSSGGGTSGGGTSGGSSSTTKGQPAAINVVGTLNGDVTTVGKLTLTYKGKAVTSLKSGRYKLTVLDETSAMGFTLQRAAKQTIKATTVPFVGRHSATVTLKAGQWFFTSKSGKKTYFIVAG